MEDTVWVSFNDAMSPPSSLPNSYQNFAHYDQSDMINHSHPHQNAAPSQAEQISQQGGGCSGASPSSLRPTAPPARPPPPTNNLETSELRSEGPGPNPAQIAKRIALSTAQNAIAQAKKVILTAADAPSPPHSPPAHTNCENQNPDLAAPQPTQPRAAFPPAAPSDSAPMEQQKARAQMQAPHSPRTPSQNKQPKAPNQAARPTTPPQPSSGTAQSLVHQKQVSLLPAVHRQSSSNISIESLLAIGVTDPAEQVIVLPVHHSSFAHLLCQVLALHINVERLEDISVTDLATLRMLALHV